MCQLSVSSANYLGHVRIVKRSQEESCFLVGVNSSTNSVLIACFLLIADKIN